jgi:hypothetical protein
MRRRMAGSAALALLSLLALTAPALAVPSKPAVVRLASPNQWLLRNSLTTGVANTTFNYGNFAAGDFPVFGDWNGDGTKTPGVHRSNLFLLRNSNSGGSAQISFGYGSPNDIAVAGDWDGDGTETVGVIRGRSDGRFQWLLRNSNTSGAADISFTYGLSGPDFPVVGDWNGDGTDTPGVVRMQGAERHLAWLLRNANTSGGANITAVYGAAPDAALVGDWNDDGTDTVGVVRGRQWLLRNSNTTGSAQLSFTYGADTVNEVPEVWR